ncbi:MAG: PilN domain-containing protein [Oligoflexia bacterium]|nr:PilN domain-containing protein [Oligoflexia bacterium]
MIKINLLRDISGSGRAQTLIGGLTSVGDSIDSSKKEVLSKIIAFVIPFIGWLGGNYYLGTQAKEEMRVLRAESAEVEKKLKELEPVVKELERFQEEKRKLDSQVEVIKRLAKERLKNVKSLDALQGIIPARAWLNELKINESKVSLAGFASDDSVVSEFMKELESSIYFANVTLSSSEEFKSNEGAVKKFEIRCNLENL